MNGAHPTPHRHSGTEPVTARSPLHQRRSAARLAIPVFVLGCALFVWLAIADAGGARVLWIVLAAICAASLPVALLELRRVRHRAHIQEWEAIDVRHRAQRRT
jgi:hypothetical protein